MFNLLGEYEISLDAKGRFLVPSAFRKLLEEGQGERFVINRGYEPCLVMYTQESWNNTTAKLQKLNEFNQKVRAFKRMFLNGASFVDIDSAGRILVPKQLLEYAGIKKEMVFSAQGNKVELWDKDTYYKYMQEQAPGFSDLADEVVGGDFMNPFDIV